MIDAKGNNAVVNTYNARRQSQAGPGRQGQRDQVQVQWLHWPWPRPPTRTDTYEQPTYDEYRRLSETRGRSGQMIELTYDNLNRVSTKRVWDANDALVNTITYQYDLLGRLYKVTDNTGTTKNTYDQAGRLIRVQYPGSKTVSYQYDAASNRTRLTYPDASYITYDYDELSRMTAVRDSSGTALASYSLR